MSQYQVHLLLEALAKVHSFQELSEGEPVISLLIRHFCFGIDEAEAAVEGPLYLKKVRAESGQCPAGELYIH